MVITVIAALLFSATPTARLTGSGFVRPIEPRDINRNLSTPKGLSDSDWSSIRTEHLRHRQAAFDVEGGWQARNYRQNWLAFFDGRGFEVKSDNAAWRWGLKLAAYGYRGQERMVGVPKSAADVEKFSYQWDSILNEWYVNGEGLEHGYTLAARPGKGEGLRFHLEVRGTLEPQVTSDGRNVAFVEPQGGQTIVNYTGLKVTDAAGHELNARFQSEARGLRLEIDDSDARYPITVDPIAQQAYLKAVSPDAFDSFGYSVAVDGNFAVVGAPYEDSNGSSPADNSLQDSGAAYVFGQTTGGWIHLAYLKASNPDARDSFGYSVAISGDTVVVGAWGEDSSSSLFPSSNIAHDAGAAYVFKSNPPVCSPGIPCVPTSWPQEAILKPLTPEMDAHFSIVAISGDTIVVGAFDEDADFFPDSGAAYVFARSSTSPPWTQQAQLFSPTTLPSGAKFGQSVAVSGNTVVVGEWRDTLLALGGRAHVFTETSGVWTRQATLQASNSETEDLFGFSVAISGDTVVVGAPGEDSNGTSPADNHSNASGAAYVFTRAGASWLPQAYLKANSPVAFDQFGYSVGVSGDAAVIGAPSVNNWGAAYVFARLGTAWSQQALLRSSNPDFGDIFGWSVAVTGNSGGSSAIMGAHMEDSDGTSQRNNSLRDAGAAYVFDIPVSAPPVTSVIVDTLPSGIQFDTNGTGCAPGTYTAPQTLHWTPGSSCTLSVAPIQPNGLRFIRWENGSTSAARNITAPATTAAYFANFGYQVTVSVSPPGSGAVIFSGISLCGGMSPCSLLFDAPTTTSAYTFTASPFGSNTFAGWTGDCSGTAACTLNLTGDKTITANFIVPTVSVTLTTSPPGRTITTSGTGCGPAGSYPTPITMQWIQGAFCTLSVSSFQGGYVFTHWDDGSTDDTLEVTAPSVPTTYTASFGISVTTVISPPNGGTVTGPNGFSCSSTICTGIFDAVPQPTFTATPAAAGDVFWGWSSACAGFGTCSPSVSSGPQSIVASFGPPNTPVGQFQQLFLPIQNGGFMNAYLEFDDVTTAGHTTARFLSPCPASVPNGFALATSGCLSIDTTATKAPNSNVVIQIEYDPFALGLTPITEPSLRLLHNHCDSTGCVQNDITDTSFSPNPDTVLHMIVGNTTSFSLFSLVLPTVSTPTINWTTPTSIVYGTALGANQLNAAASVPGSFQYSLADGTVLDAGNHTISATFTPTDLANYTPVTSQVSLHVGTAPLTVIADNKATTYGDTTPILTGQIVGLVNNDNITASYATTATNTSSPGNYPITPSLIDPGNRLRNYLVQLVNGTLAVNRATPAVTWSKPADITFGSALGSGQLNATANVPGTFVYNPAPGIVLPVGNNHVLAVSFTPSNTVNYTMAAATTTINVVPAAQSAVNLVVTRVLSRSGGNIVVQLTIANTGGTAAANVMLSSVKIGTISGMPLPQSLGAIAAGASVQATVTVAGSAGSSGAASSLTVTGTYTGGSFSSTGRIILP